MSAADQPPYPGLRPFEQEEAHLFFGRDDCVEGMIARLKETRFLAVLGSSGAGTSSLVNVGLLPALEMGAFKEMGTQWKVVRFQPGRDPFGNLARALPLPDGETEGFRRQGPRAFIKWCEKGD